MDVIRKYLTRHKNLQPPQASAKKLIIEAVCEECGITLSDTDIRIQNGGVHLTCHPTVRSEVIQCSPRLLRTLQNKHNIRLSFIR